MQFTAGWRRTLGLAVTLLVGSVLSGCATVGNLLGVGDGAVWVEQVAAANDCRGALEHDTVHVFATPAEVGQFELRRDFRLSFPGPLPAGPFALVEMASRADGAGSFAVSRQAQVQHGVLYLTATYFPSAAPPAGNPCVLVALPAGHYRHVVVVDPAGASRAQAEMRFSDDSRRGTSD